MNYLGIGLAHHIFRELPHHYKLATPLNITFYAYQGTGVCFTGGGYMDAIEGGSWEGKVDMSDPSFLMEGW